MGLRIRSGQTSVSGSHAGGSAEALERYVWKLKKLARDDKDNMFWPTLQKAILRILRLLDKERSRLDGYSLRRTTTVNLGTAIRRYAELSVVTRTQQKRT